MNILSTNNNQIFRKIENSKSEKMETFRKIENFWLEIEISINPKIKGFIIEPIYSGFFDDYREKQLILRADACTQA